MTIVEFLLARIAGDEGVARAAIRRLPDDPRTGPWWPAFIDEMAHGPVRHFGERFDPARVLAECEAKRNQIAHLIAFMEGDYAPWNEDQLGMMAAVYAAHPDYDESWRP